MRLSREEFVKYLNTYEEMCNQEDEILDALDVNPEWKPSGWLNQYYNLLSDMCELEENKLYGTLLDWYCCEAQFGKNQQMNGVYDSDGELMYRITNASEFYDDIMGIK